MTPPEALFLLLPPQGELHVSRLFHHSSILPYKSVFIAENELWVVSPLMAYGEEAPPPPPPPPPPTDDHLCVLLFLQALPETSSALTSQTG